MSFQPQHLHLLVKRNPWEAKHEWESRIKFVEDNFERFGLEKAISLSMVWANIYFLGCSYPSHTQDLVVHYPLPDQEVLMADRKKRERMERKRQDAGENEVEAKRQRVSSTEPERESTDVGTREDSRDSTVEESDQSFEQVSLQVDALISAIRKQHEKQAAEKAKRKEGNIPREVLKMVTTMCMCSQCFCSDTSPSAQVNSIVQRYMARYDSKFRYDFRFNNLPDKGTVLCQFVVNGEVIAKAEDENRKVAKQQAADRFLSYVNTYYQQEGKPCCPHEPRRR